MFFAKDREMAIRMSAESSRTTHGAQECIDAVRLFSAILLAAFIGASKEEILFEHGLEVPTSRRLADIAAGSYRNVDSDSINGSGYVVDSLEAALWCFFNTDSFRDAVLTVADLGNDADTTAAIYGQLAGAYYGESGIPEEWVARLAKGEVIQSLADRLYRSSSHA